MLAPAGRNEPADVIRLDWNLSQPAVDQDRESDGARAAEVGYGVERRTHGPPGIEDVVDDDDDAVVEILTDIGFGDLPRDVIVAATK